MSQYSGQSHHLWGPNCRVSCEVFIIVPWVRLLLLERNCVKDGLHWEETIAIIQLSTTRIKVSADNQNTWRSVYNCHRKEVHLWQNIYLLYKKLYYTSIYCSCSTAITINGNTSLDTRLCENEDCLTAAWFMPSSDLSRMKNISQPGHQSSQPSQLFWAAK